jgi:hypothetical protein
MGELSVMDNAFDGMLEAMKAGNREELMKLSGQADEDTPKTGLSRLNINYTDETDEGITLKKGVWKVYYDGEFVYADSLDFRPLVRTYEWSVWDQDEGKFSSRSVQAPSLDYQFPDTSGGNKCGRLSKSEEEELGDSHALTLASRLATCNQVFYALITMDGKTADGTEVKIENYPVVSYFKRSGFRPAREAIERLGRNTLMNEVVFDLTTKRNKMGSVTYYTPVFTQKDTVKMDDATMETMAMFLETVKASNSTILDQHKEAAKAKANEEEVDLAADFN